MKICWFKDSKIGHEKQVLAILDNLALTQDLLIEERYICLLYTSDAADES